jgi:ABC-2 type transport system ATP-binding protein
VDLTKTFRVRGGVGRRRTVAVPALRGVDLEVPAGSVCGIIGPNGSGKSTLLRILATSVLPDGGRARVQGRDVVSDSRHVRSLIGLSTGDERALYWRLSARQNLEFAAALFGVKPARPEIDSALELVELDADADRPVSGYSQGMARRLGLARALLHRPPVLLLDEPTRSLDPNATSHFHQVLRQIQVERGVTTLMTTHDLDEAASLCDEVRALRDGMITGRVTPAEEARPHQALVRLLD